MHSLRLAVHKVQQRLGCFIYAKISRCWQLFGVCVIARALAPVAISYCLTKEYSVNPESFTRVKTSCYQSFNHNVGADASAARKIRVCWK